MALNNDNLSEIQLFKRPVATVVAEIFVFFEPRDYDSVISN